MRTELRVRIVMVTAPPRIFWFAEPVACSDPATPLGRLLLADDGLTFVPGTRSRAAARADQGWLSHALSDDENLEDLFAAVAHRSPADQRAAIAGSLHLAAPIVTLTGRVLVAGDHPRTFTLPPVLGASLVAWQTTMSTATVSSKPRGEATPANVTAPDCTSPVHPITDGPAESANDRASGPAAPQPADG